MRDLSSLPVEPVGPDDHLRSGDGEPLIIYAEFSCPECAIAAERLRESGAAVCFRHFALAARSPGAVRLAIASEAAHFATPGVDIGLFCSTPMVALSRNVPRKQAMEMLLTGEPISAATAQSIGLVNRVVPAGTERDVAIALAQQVALKSAYTVKLGKEAFYRQAEMSLTEAYRFAAEVMTENMMARDAEEGIGAFIQKREPVWSGE